MTPSPSPRILIVEDDTDFRATLCDWLTCSGYAVSEAADGREALALARITRFQVVLTDLRMPGMDGLQLLDRLKEFAPEVPVIFLSGQATVKDAVAALRDGRGFDFLEKPLSDLSLLDAVIARALGHAQRQALPATEALPAAKTGASEPSGREESLMDRVLAYIHAHYATAITLQEVADGVGYSPAYLTSLARRETGKSIQKWITEVRMQHARRLMLETDAPIKRIAASVGYFDPNYFVRHFRKLYGVPPMAWRQLNASRPSEDEPDSGDASRKIVL